MKSLRRSGTESMGRAAVLVTALLVWTACEQTEAPDPCGDALPPVIELPTHSNGQIGLVAELSVDEWVETDASGETDVGAMLGAHFADFSGYDEEKIPAVPFGQACVGEVGRHVIHAEPDQLTAEEVVFRGLLVGDRNLEKNDAGQFDMEILEGSIFSDKGGDALAVEVTSNGALSSFPAFEISAKAPPLVELEELTIGVDRSLELGWQASDATYFEVVLTATSKDPDIPPNRLRCLLEDDGCHLVPAEAMEWLLSQGTSEVKVRLKRHTLTHTVPTEGALAQLDATRSLEFQYTLE